MSCSSSTLVVLRIGGLAANHGGLLCHSSGLAVAGCPKEGLPEWEAGLARGEAKRVAPCGVCGERRRWGGLRFVGWLGPCCGAAAVVLHGDWAEIWGVEG